MFDLEKQIPKALYSSTVVLKAAYAFLDRAYVHISDDETEWTLSIKYKESVTSKDIFLMEIENELIAQAVRERVFQQTKTIREMLMARAMTSTVIDTEDPIQKMQAENQDISDEELDSILKSWFERNE